MVSRRASIAFSLVFSFVLGCSGNRSKAQVEKAIMTRLQTHSGLDLKELDITTSSVSFNKNKAYATVAFHPKGDTNVLSGMVMKYTLEQRDGKWVVVDIGDSQGHSMTNSMGGGSQLPAGHPPVGQGQQIPNGNPQ
jgi:hypothetical protein